MKSKNWNRRDLLKTIGFAAVGTTMVKDSWGASPDHVLPDYLRNQQYKKPGEEETSMLPMRRNSRMK